MKIRTISVRSIPKTHESPAQRILVDLVRSNTIGVISGIKKDDVIGMYRIRRNLGLKMQIHFVAAAMTATVIPGNKKRRDISIHSAAEIRRQCK